MPFAFVPPDHLGLDGLKSTNVCAAPIPFSFPFTFFLFDTSPELFPFLSSIRSSAIKAARWRQQTGFCAAWGFAAPLGSCFVFGTFRDLRQETWF